MAHEIREDHKIEKLDKREVVNRAVTQEDLDNSEDLVKAGAKVGDRYNFPVGVELDYAGGKVVNSKTNSGADVPSKVRGSSGRSNVRPVTQHDLDTLPHLKENGVQVGDEHDFTV